MSWRVFTDEDYVVGAGFGSGIPEPEFDIEQLDIAINVNAPGN